MSSNAASERITLRRDFGWLSGVGTTVRAAWRKRWVKVITVLLALPVIFYFILWLLFARGLPSAEIAAQLRAGAADLCPRHQWRAGAELRPRAAGPARLSTNIRRS